MNENKFLNALNPEHKHCHKVFILCQRGWGKNINAGAKDISLDTKYITNHAKDLYVLWYN